MLRKPRLLFLPLVWYGVVIHDNVAPSKKRQNEGPAPRPLYLQGYGYQVYYRKIWVEEKKCRSEKTAPVRRLLQ